MSMCEVSFLRYADVMGEGGRGGIRLAMTGPDMKAAEPGGCTGRRMKPNSRLGISTTWYLITNCCNLPSWGREPLLQIVRWCMVEMSMSSRNPNACCELIQILKQRVYIEV